MCAKIVFLQNCLDAKNKVIEKKFAFYVFVVFMLLQEKQKNNRRTTEEQQKNNRRTTEEQQKNNKKTKMEKRPKHL